MRKVKILSMLMFLGIASFAQKVANKHTASSQNLTIIDNAQLVKEVAKGDAYLVDVRTNEEFQKSHLKFASNIDVTEHDFLSKINKLKKGKAIYLYCRSGHRSGLAADSLLNLGYKNVFNIGGLDSLINKGFIKN